MPTSGTDSSPTGAGLHPGGRNLNENRHGRSRHDLPGSDPYVRVPADFLFPTEVQEIGQGMESGRNWLVLRDGDTEPVLRAPLRILRLHRESSGQNTNYPGESDVIPAGTSLGDVCRFYPRHVWGEMFRIFRTERWNGRRIWELLPVDARHNSNERPWNYLQAAIGREIDAMMREAGHEREVVKRPRTSGQPSQQASPNSAGTSSASEGDTDDDIWQAEDENWVSYQTTDNLAALAGRVRDRTFRVERRILRLQNANGAVSDEAAERAYRQRHNSYLRQRLFEFEIETGPMTEREPLDVFRTYWTRIYPRQPGQDEAKYNKRADWYAARGYLAVRVILHRQAEEEFAALWEATQMLQ
jgi:hypothetical protein